MKILLALIAVATLQACATTVADSKPAEQPIEAPAATAVMSAATVEADDDRWSLKVAEDKYVKSPFRPNGKIDYPYWDQYLARHGSDATVEHFFALSADEPAVATKSFERFCRFNQILPILKRRRDSVEQ